MSPSSDDFEQPPSPPDAARARDRGLRRGRRLTRWIAVTAVAGTAALGSLYTHLLPGSSASPVPSGPTPHPAASSSAAPRAGSDGDHGDSARQGSGDSDDEGEDDTGAARASQPAPQPPVQPPAPTQQPPHTTTGAS
ncbi:hypothetical protein ACFYZ8_09620 [Streptomyces sp. NPDC001668]|uniref:hypothetical protein n=1 Tax=unclassified Streptomyces TaxID=2593676 RepID=UPI0036746F3D